MSDRLSVIAVCSSARRRVGEHPVELAEPCVPELLECGEHSSGTGDLIGVAAHETFATMAVFAHESRPFQHGDVFLYGGEAHVVVGGERAHRGLTGEPVSYT